MRNKIKNKLVKIIGISLIAGVGYLGIKACQYVNEYTKPISKQNMKVEKQWNNCFEDPDTGYKEDMYFIRLQGHNECVKLEPPNNGIPREGSVLEYIVIKRSISPFICDKAVTYSRSDK